MLARIKNVLLKGTLMTSRTSAQIECPNCGTSIDINQALSDQLDSELRGHYEAESKKQQQAITKQKQQVESDRVALTEQKEQLEKNVAAEVKQQVKAQEVTLRQQLKADLVEEQSEQLKLLQQEVNEKSNQLKELNRTRAEVERLKREKLEMKDSIEAESERKLNQELGLEREKIQKAESEKSQLNLSEKENVIRQLKTQLDIAVRKAEQGSTQLQGEVQELAIEQWLNENYPLDTIEEIKKGERGADTMHTVNTRSHQNCGTIYYESKRTKSFQPSWVEKFKADIREKGAHIGVLITSAMPADMPRMGQREGIWICSFEEFKGLSAVLRDSIVRMSHAISIQDNKGDKMSMLYDYLTGNEFRMQIEAIVEGFSQMQLDLIKEKNAMNRIWKNREKQIEKVMLNTTHMYGSVKGIAGSAVKSLPLLELPEDDE
jgi:hypothetical protein